jgi:hypothetical protein
LYSTQQKLEDGILSDKEIIENANNKLFVLENKLMVKEYLISNLKSELEKYFDNDTSSIKQNFIAEPDRINLELYNELNSSTDIITKISRMLNQEKFKISKLENKVKVNLLFKS